MEILRAGVDGWLLPPRCPELWADRVAPLLSDRGARRRMGLNGRERARSFSPQAHAAAMVETYRSLLPADSF